ncbi:MAG: nucleoside triphosphate pyrophosphohydrolase [Actinobacteria bacterium]|nr:nucleoside triphosphate pyrophosphohydrolase [Actinomycetota bacterium]
MRDEGKLFSILVGILKKLRSPEGCLWDREQDHMSLKRSLLEEAYEVVENIESNSSEGLKEELGDLLLQVVFHSQIAAERGAFDIVQVLKSIISKLIRRHPHVFEGKTVESCSEILANWEDIKRKEREGKHKGTSSIFSDIPHILPSLHYAYEIQARASRVGFDWDSPEGVFEKIKEEIKELCIQLNKPGYIEEKVNGVINNGVIDEKSSKGIVKGDDKIKDEIGDILFSIVNFCRHLGIDSEECLKSTCKKFIKRFDFMEEYAQKKSLDLKKLSLEEKDRLWEISKKFI